MTLGHGLIGEPSECHLCLRIAVDVYHHIVWCLVWLKCLNLSLQFSYVSISRVATCCLFSNHHLDVRRYGIVFSLILSICLDNEWVEYLLLHLKCSCSGVTTIFCGNRDSRCTRFQTDNGTLVQRCNSWVSDRPGDIAVSSIHWQDVCYDLYGVGSINVQRCWVKFYTCNSHQFCQSPTCVTNVQAIGSSTQGWRTWTEVEVTTLWIYEERIRGEAARVGRTRFSFTIVVNGVFYFTTIDVECILVGVGRVSHNTIGDAQVWWFADSDTTQVWSCTIVHGDVINHYLVLLTSSLATWTNVDNAYVLILYQVVERRVLHLEISAGMLTSRCIIVEVDSTTSCIVEETVLNQHIIHMGVRLIVVRDSPIHPASKLAVLEGVCTCVWAKCTDRIIALVHTIEANAIESSRSVQTDGSPLASQRDDWFSTFSRFEDNALFVKVHGVCLVIHTVSHQQSVTWLRLTIVPSDVTCWLAVNHSCLHGKRTC